MEALKYSSFCVSVFYRGHFEKLITNSAEILSKEKVNEEVSLALLQNSFMNLLPLLYFRIM